MPSGDRWVDRYAGSVVRPYALTGGRTEPATGEVLDLVAVIVAVGHASAGRASRGDAGGKAGEAGEPLDLGPEHRRILALCRQPATLADVAAATALPVGVVRVLLADLILHGAVTVLPGLPADEQPPADLLKEVLHGLRAL